MDSRACESAYYRLVLVHSKISVYSIEPCLWRQKSYFLLKPCWFFKVAQLHIFTTCLKISIWRNNDILLTCLYIDGKSANCIEVQDTICIWMTFLLTLGWIKTHLASLGILWFLQWYFLTKKKQSKKELVQWILSLLMYKIK